MIYVFICHHISSLVKQLFKFLTNLKIDSFVFLLLSYKNSLYILDISPILKNIFKIFSQFIAYQFIFITEYLEEQKFLSLRDSNSPWLFFLLLWFMPFVLYLRNLCLTQDHMFLLEV